MTRSANPGAGLMQRQRAEELDDLALGLRALPADQALGEMVLATPVRVRRRATRRSRPA